MSRSDITGLLHSIRDGERQAIDALISLVYDEMKRLARARLGWRSGSETLDTTALVHETYLKLFDQTRVTLNDRRHFFSVAAIAMRQIIVDRARRQAALKRGAKPVRVNLDEAQLSIEDAAESLLAIEQALRRLADVDERLSRVVELRFFGGFSVEQTAEVVGVDARTIKRDWRKARALLYDTLAMPEGA